MRSFISTSPDLCRTSLLRPRRACQFGLALVARTGRAGRLLQGKNESSLSDEESRTIGKPGCCAPDSSKSTQTLAHLRKSFLRYCFRFFGWNKVANFIVEGCAVPHPPLRVREEFPNAISRIGEWKFNNRARLGIQAPKNVVIIRAVPNKVVAIDTNSVRRWVRVGQRVFLEGFCFRVEAANLTRPPLTKPYEPLGV